MSQLSIADYFPYARINVTYQNVSKEASMAVIDVGADNHCDYQISTGKLEGTNNTIKVIKRKAYGFHDQRYFTLKVKQAFNSRPEIGR